MLYDNYLKFKQYLKDGGIFYALWRGIKYSIFLIRSLPSGFKLKKKSFNAVVCGKIDFVFSEKGMKIFFEDAELTSGPGLYSMVNTLGIWTDSRKADWSVVSREEGCFILRAVFHELPLSQVWTVEIENQNMIKLQVDMEPEEDLYIDELRLMGSVSNRYKSWMSDFQQGDFGRLDNQVYDVYLGDRPVHLTGVRFPLQVNFPAAFVFYCNDQNWMPVIQNSPASDNARLIGIRKMFPERKLYRASEKYRIVSSGIEIFENGEKLDERVEVLRQNYLGVFSAADKPVVHSKTKILLLNMPWQKDGKPGVRAGSRWPHIKNAVEDNYMPFPFFLAYAASLLHSRGIEASMIDAVALGLGETEFLERIIPMEFDYLVVETSIPSFYDDLRLLKKISAAGANVILCGPNCEIYEPSFLQQNDFIRFVLCGEYEFTLLDLVESLRDGKDLSLVKGLVYRDREGTARVTPKREPFRLDLLPWPLRDGLPMDKYLDAPGEMPLPSVQVMASRGCPFRCQFCLWPQVLYGGNHYRVRDVKDVVDEMQYLVEKKGFKSVYFDDDTFNVGKERMLEFCREIKKRKLEKVKWAIMARADLMDEEILRSMKSAGLWAVKYGVESSTQHLVDNINKSMDLKKATKMIELSQELGIRVHLTFTFGLPGETVETIRETIKYVKKINPFSAQFSIATPFPGTAYYKIMESQGLVVSKELSDYDGHLKSVIKLKNLSPAQLEAGKEAAIRSWQDHLIKRALWQDNIIKFFSRAREKGLSRAVIRSFSYLVTLFFSRGMSVEDYKKPKDYDDVIRNAKLGPADILLIQCPPWDIAMPPLGIAYLSSYLKKHGYRVCVFDLNIALYNLTGDDDQCFWRQKSYGDWVSEDPAVSASGRFREMIEVIVAKLLKKTDAGFVGVSINFASISVAVVLLKAIKAIKPKIKIILGGWGCSNEHMRSFFSPGLVDVFVVGEGEATLLEVMNVLKGHKKEGGIPGAIFSHRLLTHYEARKPIQDLNVIPWPTFKEFNLRQYHTSSIPLFSSRGCIGKCNFCNDWSLSLPYRFRDARNIFEEIKYHVKNNHTHSFSFKDLLCNGDIPNLNLLLDLIIQSGLAISWDSQAIARKEMTYGLLCKMQQAGCHTLVYGIESFSNNVLKRMGKIFTSQIAEEVLKNTCQAGIRSFVNIIVGFPGETDEDFQETLRALERNGRYIESIGAVSVCLVNHNSDLENNFQRYDLVLSEDVNKRAKEWTCSSSRNDYLLRQEKARQVLSIMDKMGLKYETLTI